MNHRLSCFVACAFALASLPAAAAATPNNLQSLWQMPAGHAVHAVERAAQKLMRDAAWSDLDPTLARAGDLHMNTLRVGDDFVVHATPVVDGVEVEGADRVLVLRDGHLARVGALHPLHVLNRFAWRAGDAMVACATKPSDICAPACANSAWPTNPCISSIISCASSVLLPLPPR